ncbi:MAG: 7-cyano-7-deazaguanine synthase QueC [Betaproteobacteria bacterium]|nr:MAG: 7-cyano-7-deazaguanine synthase QueC [Betaproteobacteria bacterium]
MDDAALVLFSGGQDSTVCLAWALGRYARVETIGFHYGQRHAVEMQCRTKVLHHLRTEFSQWAGKLGADTVLELDVIREVSESALTRDAEITMGANKLPTTFVPGRNLLFFTTAAALAYRRGIKVLVGGMCETDYSGYPDCRDDTLKALQVTLNLGLERRFVIETPLMWIDKAATWRLAEELGGKTLVQLIIEHTHSCYRGDRTERHAWGYGCGACPACELRARGYKRFRESGSEP